MKINRRNFNLKVTVLVTYLIMLATNAMATLLPINGITTGEISDFYENLFAPAGITFSIWGVIYFLLLLYCLYQFGIFQDEEETFREDMFRKIGILFSISSVLNTIWIFTWHYKLLEVSVPIMLGILVTLIMINNISRKTPLSLKDYIFIRLPFSVYFGWITVATIANITALLVKLGFGGFGLSEAIWTIVILIVGLLIGSLTIMRNRDIAYGLVLIWAYAGIYIKHISKDGFNANYTSIIFTVVASIVLFVMVEIYTLVNLKRKDKRLRDM